MTREQVIAELRAAAQAMDRGREMDRDMQFSITGVGPGASTGGIPINPALLYEAARMIRNGGADG